MTFIRQFLYTSIICYLCMSVGIVFTWPSTTMSIFKSKNTTLHRSMTDIEVSLFSGLSSIGALISTPAAGFLLDIIGRKYCVIISSLMHVICWTLIVASNRVEVLLAAMFCSGIGGAGFLVVPVYVGEICQDSIRGAMTSTAMIFYAVGMILSYAIGGYMDFYPMCYVLLSISVLGMVLLGLLRESPLYLMQKGREQEAKRSIAFYRNAKIDSKIVLQEIETIQRAINPNLDEPGTTEEEFGLNPKKSTKKLSLLQFIKKSYSTRKALVVVLILMTLSVFQGLVAVQVYAEVFFSNAIPAMPATLSSVILSIISAVTGLVAAYLIDILGRKPLMLYSSIASIVCCVLLGLQINTNWGPNILTAIILYVFCFTYTIGAGTIPYVLSPELFLPEVKSLMAMLVVEWAWLCNFILLFVYDPLQQAIGLGEVFYLFAGMCFATAVFTHFFLPETKGLPVDAIQVLFAKRK